MLNSDFIILCGGQGTRLRSTIGESQKVMASVGDEPFLDLLIKYIKKQGGRRVILSTGYKAQDVEAYYAGGRFQDVVIEFSREDTPLGTGGAIKKACGLVRTENFFVLNGDSFCPVEFAHMLEFHVRHDAQASVAVAKVIDGQDYGTITLDSESRIGAFQEKVAGGAAYVNAGIYCFKKGIEAQMPHEDRFSLEKDFFPRLAGPTFYGYVVALPFFDIGTPERYEAAKQHLK
jgi:D-glycero-alpha-D-manno-heptose 1-phosphate guanylyltransferase